MTSPSGYLHYHPCNSDHLLPAHFFLVHRSIYLLVYLFTYLFIFFLCFYPLIYLSLPRQLANIWKLLKMEDDCTHFTVTHILLLLDGQLGTPHPAPPTSSWSQLLLIFFIFWYWPEMMNVWSHLMNWTTGFLCTCVCVAFAVRLHDDQPRAEPFLVIKMQLTSRVI